MASERGTYAKQRRYADSPASGGVTFLAIRCLWWVAGLGGDGVEVEFAAGQIDHRAEVVHVPEAAGAGFDVLDDAVESLEDRVGAPMVEVGEDVLPVPAELFGEGLHRFQPRMHHPRAQCLETGLRLRAAGAVGVDVLQAFAHPARPGGLRPPLRQIALDLRLRAREVGLVPGPQVLRAFEQRVLLGLGLADPVDGLVGVFDDMELVDDFGRVGQVVADALGEPQAHVARHQAHAVRVAVVRHEIVREPFHRGRVLARHHADHVALRQVGDDGDVPVAPAAGLVDADRLHARVVLVQARLPHVVADEPPQAGVVLADLFGDVRDRLAFRQFHDHRLEQERGRRCPDAPTAPSRSSRRAPGTPPVARRRG